MHPDKRHPTKQQNTKRTNLMKKILFILIDAFAARVAVPAMEAGRLPNMTALSEAGQLWDNCTAIFPSITPAATSSLITGRYPSDHGIVGAYWYDEDEKTVVYFGGDLRVLLNEGTGSAFNDLVIRLNEERLRAPTLFEKIEAAGYTAASLNYLVFHGIHEHKVNGSWLARLLTGALFDDNTVYGPSILYHGDLIETKLPGNGDRLSSAGGLFHRLGFDDQATADLLVDLINKGPKR
jgi:hypothetical protein